MNATSLEDVLTSRFEKSTTIPETFFVQESEPIARACWAMARRFHRGGRLLAFGKGSWATDAQHISVEFVHPVIVGKRALPALALTNDSATLSGLEGDAEDVFTRQIRVLGRTEDIALGFVPADFATGALEALAQAKKMGLLTLGLGGGTESTGDTQSTPSPIGSGLDFYFHIPSDDPLVIQETHETLYHVLWELVHIFFEHEGMLR